MLLCLSVFKSLLLNPPTLFHFLSPLQKSLKISTRLLFNFFFFLSLSVKLMTTVRISPSAVTGAVDFSLADVNGQCPVLSAELDRVNHSPFEEQSLLGFQKPAIHFRSPISLVVPTASPWLASLLICDHLNIEGSHSVVVFSSLL